MTIQQLSNAIAHTTGLPADYTQMLLMLALVIGVLGVLGVWMCIAHTVDRSRVPVRRHRERPMAIYTARGRIGR